MPLPRVRFTVRRLMAVVAIIGLLLWAWLYHRENASADRSWTTMQLRAFAAGDAVQRRMAIENLAHFGPGDRDRVLPALAAGMVDDDWQVRLAAAKSLGTVGRGWVWVWNGVAGEHVDLAMRTLVEAFDDPRAEVRIEAMRSLGALYTDVKAPSRSPGRRTAIEAFDATERRAVALLLRRMSDSDPAIRASAVHAFSRVGSASGASLDPLVRAGSAGRAAGPSFASALGTVQSHAEWSSARASIRSGIDSRGGAGRPSMAQPIADRSSMLWTCLRWCSRGG